MFHWQDGGTKTVVFSNTGYDEFPLNQRLCVFVDVTEKASGIKFSKSDNSALFTDNPIQLDCSLMPPFYKSSIPLQMQVSRGRPAVFGVARDLRTTKGINIEK